MDGSPIRVVMLEDTDDDALLIERELKKSGLLFATRRAVDRTSFESALREFEPDLILSDHSLVGFTGVDALHIAREVAATVPFIFVSGTIGEERAIEAMQTGATDYVIKDRLVRLVPVVKRALREREERREREALRREYLQAQKMESLGRMATAIAHDFNNILTVACGNAELLAKLDGNGEARARMLEAVLKAGEQGRELTTRLLQFSRGESGDSATFDLNARIGSFLPMFQSLLGSQIRLQVASYPGPLTLQGNPGQIDQIVMNLLVNARDAIVGGGHVEIKTGRLTISEGQMEGFPLVVPGEYAQLLVRDDGAGMSEEVRARVFEPFFTTKGPGKGTGLGLATVYAIAHQYGGGVTVESTLGQGSTFRVVLRLPPETPERAAERPAVLLVDDEEAVRTFGRIVLEATSHRVVAAAGGLEAVAIFEEHPEQFALLITDVMMPELDGLGIARRARRIRPDLPIVFMSGVPTALDQAAREFTNVGCLGKPFRPRDLLDKIHHLTAPA